MRRLLLFAAALSLAALQLSCAVTDGSDQFGQTAYRAPAQPAARMGLLPVYRVFFDELADEGDWVLIEPYGWCFRPAVNFVAWRPYQQGWWEPSGFYGWIWNSTEPFGWITYHYGSWFYDAFQGWAWQPGPVWGPSWVAWVSAGEYIGWAPLAPRAYDDFARVPGGVFTYVGGPQFAGQDISTQALYVSRLPETRSGLHEILNLGHASGAAFNRGPDIDMLRRMGTSVPARPEAPQIPRVKLPPPSGELGDADLIDRTRRLVSVATREYDAFREQGIAPPPVPAGRPPSSSPPMLKKPPARPLPADSTRVKPPGPAPRDSTAKRDRTRRAMKPAAKPLGKPAAAPDSTRN